MKLTTERLKKIIQEELESLNQEAFGIGRKRYAKPAGDAAADASMALGDLESRTMAVLKGVRMSQYDKQFLKDTLDMAMGTHKDSQPYMRESAVEYLEKMLTHYEKSL